jgi:hypothetical protein
LSNEIRGFEDEVLTQLTVNSACKGVVIAILEELDSPLPEAFNERIVNGINGGMWGLEIDFTRGARTQEWTMMTRTRSSPYYAMTKGVGDPKAIARDICSVVAGRGIRVVN